LEKPRRQPGPAKRENFTRVNDAIGEASGILRLKGP